MKHRYCILATRKYSWSRYSRKKCVYTYTNMCNVHSCDRQIDDGLMVSSKQRSVQSTLSPIWFDQGKRSLYCDKHADQLLRWQIYSQDGQQENNIFIYLRDLLFSTLWVNITIVVIVILFGSNYKFFLIIFRSIRF